MKYICNAMQEGRCKGEPGKCNHRFTHLPHLLDGTFEGSCTIQRFCEIQQEMVYCCAEAVLFPAMVNPITITDDLALLFVNWVDTWLSTNVIDKDVCERIADSIKKQFEQRSDNETGG